MKTNTTLVIRLFVLGCIIPIIMSTMAYAGFSTNYTSDLFSKQGFEHYYGKGIYKYRILSPVLLFKTYELIKDYDLPVITPRLFTLMDNDGDPRFYTAYFYINTFFLCLCCIVLLLTLGAAHTHKDFIVVDLPLLFMCSLMVLTQYVIVPYDTLSYFLFSLAAALILFGNKAPWQLPVLCGILILATLIRETSAFILAFYFAFHHQRILSRQMSLKANREQVGLFILSLCFLCTYLALRVVFGYEHSIYQAFLLSRNLNLSYSLLGMLFFASIALLITSTTMITREISVFIVVTLPYVVFIFLFADPWEIRLWVPLILPLIIMKVRACESAMPPHVLEKHPHA